MIERPTLAERFFFDNNGYLVVEDFLAASHVAALTAALQGAARRRRGALAGQIPQTGMTRVNGADTRIFYILDEDPLFLELLDWPALMPYVHGLLTDMPHHHASDGIMEFASEKHSLSWHIDGHCNSYRGFRAHGQHIPLLQLKVGYYLSNMLEPGQGNLTVIPGSHKAIVEPEADYLRREELFPGALEICGPPGTMVLFHNALWHTNGPWRKANGKRFMLYYAYEHPWMMASQEHWGYSPEFYNALSPERRKLFHGFLFDPPEQRWG